MSQRLGIYRRELRGVEVPALRAAGSAGRKSTELFMAGLPGSICGLAGEFG